MQLNAEAIRFAKGMTSTLVLLVFTAGASSGQAQVAPRSSEPEAQLPFTLCCSVYPKALELAHVQVYEDSRSTAAGRRYLIEPYFYPAWAQFQESVKTQCDGKADSIVARTSLEAQFSSLVVNKEIVEELEKQRTDATLEKLQSFPFIFLKVETGGLDNDGLPTRVRWRWPPNLSEQLGSGTLATISRFIGEPQRIAIEDSCEQLQRIASDVQNVQAHLYTTSVKISVDTTSVSIESFLRQREFDDLLRGENAVGSKQGVVKSKTGGFGINLGKLAIGSAKSKTASEVADTRKRAVTGNLIQAAAGEFAKSLSILQRREIAPPSGTDTDIVALLTKFVTENSEAIEGTFTKAASNQWQLKVGELSRTFTQDDIDELVKGDGKSNLTSKKKTEAKAPVKGAPLEVKDENEMSFQDERGIEWKRNGKEWIPTSVKLYFLSEDSLRSLIVGKHENALVQRGDVQRITLTQVSADRMPEAVTALLTGPEKNLIPIKAGLYRTDTYWAGGWRGGPYWCQPEVTPKEGMTIVGAKHLELVATPLDARRRGCTPSGHCDSHGEACRSYYRAGGCYVSTKWLDWYRQRMVEMKLKQRDEDICSQPSKSN